MDYVKYGGRIVLSCFVFSIIFMLGYIVIGNSVISLSKISEKTFDKLGFENPKIRISSKRVYLIWIVYMLVSWSIEKI